MQTDKLEEYQITAFISAVGRARWFLLGTVLVSALILVQIYVNSSDCKRRQLAEAIAQTPDGQGKLDNWLARTEANYQADEAKGLPPDKLLKDARAVVDAQAMVNTLKDLKSGDHPLWGLAFDVPDDEFVVLQGFMLAVLQTCLWLSVRAMVETLQTCNPDLVEIARLNLLFPLSSEAKAGQDRVAKIVQTVALWAPVGTLAIALVAFVWSTGPQHWWAGSILIVALTWCTWATRSAQYKVTEMDRLIQEKKQARLQRGPEGPTGQTLGEAKTATVSG